MTRFYWPVAAVLHLLALLPAALIHPRILPICLLWSGVLAWGVERIVRRAWTGQLGAALLALASSLVFAFVDAWDREAWGLLVLAPGVLVAGLLVIPGPWPRRILGFFPPLLAVVWGALIFYAFAWAGTERNAPRLHDDFLFLLRADDPPPALDDAGRRAAIGVVRATLVGQGVDAATLPAALRESRGNRAWVTLYRDDARRGSTRGQAEAGALVDQLVTATKAAWDAAKPRADWDAVRGDVRIQVDLGGPLRPIGLRGLRSAIDRLQDRISGGKGKWSTLVYDAEPGVDGYVLRVAGKEAVTVPSDAITEGWFAVGDKTGRDRSKYVERTFEQLTRKAGIARTGTWPEGAELWTFTTDTFVLPDPNSEAVHPVYRGNVIGPDTLSDAQLVDLLGDIGRWLMEQVGDDGRFDYEYIPNTDDHGRGYNEVRHAGAVYGLFHMVHLCQREPALRAERDLYLAAGLKALDRVYRNLGTPPGTTPEEGFVAFLEGRNGEKANSGASALTLLSFLGRPKPEEVPDSPLAAQLWREGDEKIIAGLAKTIESMIDKDGAVYQLFTEARAGGGVKKEPLYYPGEVMLALARYSQVSGEPRWAEGSAKIGKRQIGLLRRPWNVPDHWVMQALDILDQLQPDERRWRKGAYQMARRFVVEQYPPHVPPFPDYRGGYRRGVEAPRTTRAASRGEALGGTVRIAWRHGDPSWEMEESLIEGARHMAEQTWNERNSWFLPNKKEAMGALRMGIIDTHCRIDNNQHGLVALDNALEVVRRRAKAGAAK